MLSDIDPMVIVLAVVALAVVGTVMGVARRGRREPAPDRRALPAGADAALWSVTEVLPDPRNHLAIKDPTSELRLTARERADAALWSVTEVLPDPRNHLAIKDPTSELRLTARERAEAAHAASPQVRPADAARSAQSQAARQAALAKRAVPHDVDAEATEAIATVLGTPEVADDRHLTLLPEHLGTIDPLTATDGHGHRWGESPARAS